MKKTLLLFIGLSILISCSNDDSDVSAVPNNSEFTPPNFVGTVGYLKKMKWKLGDGTPLCTWFYNYNGNKLDKKVSYLPNTNESYLVYVYQYESNNIKKIITYNGASTSNVMLERNYLYDSNSRIIEESFSYPNNVSQNYKYIYDYTNISLNDVGFKVYQNDASNNYSLTSNKIIRINSNDEVLSIRESTSNINELTVVYEYDDKISPMLNIQGFSKNYSNFEPGESKFNNVTAQINPSNNSNTITINYEYNTSNKPKKATYINSEGPYLIVDFEYYQ